MHQNGDQIILECTSDTIKELSDLQNSDDKLNKLIDDLLKTKQMAYN